VSHYEGPETEIKQMRGGSPTEKQANVKRLFKRLLTIEGAFPGRAFPSWRSYGPG
jgi:hypothetical protein